MRYQISDPADRGLVEATLGSLRAATPRCGPTRVLALDGPSGAGKTTLAEALVAHLRCPLVRMDDLYPGWDGLAEAVGLLAEQVLLPLAHGEAARYRVWDWERSRWGGTKGVPATDLLVVEGCGASVRPAGDLAALRVWLEADQEVRRARGLARDGDTFAPHWRRWAEQEARVFAADRTRERADLVIDTTGGGAGMMSR